MLSDEPYNELVVSTMALALGSGMLFECRVCRVLRFLSLFSLCHACVSLGLYNECQTSTLRELYTNENKGINVAGLLQFVISCGQNYNRN